MDIKGGKLKLHDEIEAFVKNQIKDVKYVDDIFTIRKFKMANSKDLDYNKSYSDLYLYKKILQITINLYNNYELYENFRVKFIMITKDLLHPLDSYYDFDKNSGQWRCTRAPEQSHVVDALFKYVFCFLTLEMKKKHPNMINIEQKSLLCAFCDEGLSPGQDKCHFCDASVEGGTSGTKDEIGHKDDKFTEKHRRIDNGEEREYDKKKDLSRERNLINKERESNNYRFKKEDQSDGWKCGGCGLFNQYSFINCVACCGLFSEGLWTCGQCSMGNSCANDACGTCETRNDNVRMKVEGEAHHNDDNVNNNREDKNNYKNDCGKCVFLEDGTVEICEDCKAMIKRNEGHIAVDRWKCGKCELLQSYDCTHCGACGDGRMMRGLWMCAKCTFINQCNNDECLACGDCNELLMKYCEYCKKNRVRMNEVRCVDCARMHSGHHGAVRWQCWYDNCREMNKAEDDYCCKCHLWRYNSHNRGDTVSILYYGQPIEVWMCNTCYCLNPPSQLVCKREGCGHTRYGEIWCWRCWRWTDGTTKYCEKHRVIWGNTAA